MVACIEKFMEKYIVKKGLQDILSLTLKGLMEIICTWCIHFHTNSLVVKLVLKFFSIYWFRDALIKFHKNFNIFTWSFQPCKNYELCLYYIVFYYIFFSCKLLVNINFYIWNWGSHWGCAYVWNIQKYTQCSQKWLWLHLH